MRRALTAILLVTAPSAAAAAPPQQPSGGKGKGKGKGGGGKGGGKGEAGAGTCTATGRNCWATRRCCDGGGDQPALCVTKEAGLRFAQCRTDGCKSVCGWECRVLKQSGASDAYGAGSQTKAAALATMAAPYNDSAAAVGDSYRLGNVIDSWCVLPAMPAPLA